MQWSYLAVFVSFIFFYCFFFLLSEGYFRIFFLGVQNLIPSENVKGIKPLKLVFENIFNACCIFNL